MTRMGCWSGLLGLVLLVGCGSSDDASPSCGNRQCSAGTPTNAPRGITMDGRVAISAKDAWPNRGTEPAPLAPQDLADACALIAACRTDANGAPLTDDAIATLVQNCARGKASANAKEERAVMQEGLFERLDWEAHMVLAGAHDCASIRKLENKRPSELLCQEDGCWWESPVPVAPLCCKPVPTITCAGDVATVASEGLTFTRDCTHAYAKCDPKSSTGCTDRAPVACDKAANDACDGDVKLGCDGDNKVSFHDCARYPGGKCVTRADGADCDLHNTTCDESKLGCDTSGNLNVCVAGKTVNVNCTALGMGACAKGHCKGL